MFLFTVYNLEKQCLQVHIKQDIILLLLDERLQKLKTAPSLKLFYMLLCHSPLQVCII